jgi:hypothetical protein
MWARTVTQAYFLPGVIGYSYVFITPTRCRTSFRPRSARAWANPEFWAPPTK